MYTPNLILLGVDHHCKRIVFFSTVDRHLALYSPYQDEDDEHSKWEIIKIPCKDALRKMSRYVRTIRSINDKTLYWVDMDTHTLHGYNFEYNVISDPVHMSFISKYSTLMILKSGVDVNFPELLHMNGDRFCLFWYREGNIHLEFNNLNCTILSISNKYNDVDGSFVLDVSELATHTYSIPAPARCYRLINIIPMLVSNSKAAAAI
jgi:hypothetical protein